MKRRTRRDKIIDRETGTQAIKDLGIPYNTQNGGAELELSFRFHTVTYWPGSRKWEDRRHKEFGQGIEDLLYHVGLATCRLWKKN